MRFTPEFLDDLRARLSLAEIVGRRVPLRRRGNSYLGLCPFHKEKTPSFHVHDDKGFYHCFGCQAHGDAIEFVIKTENLTFPEAVTRLAHEAGVKLPEARPSDPARERQTRDIGSACEAAAQWFAQQLAGPGGAGARAYLAKRGLDEKTIARFRIGLAPDRRHALKHALCDGTAKSGSGVRFPEKILLEAGLLIAPEGGGETYDRFRGRIVFPITDRRGRVIAFGGRALGDVAPKYLNSPETPLFHKGRVLYNLARALPAMRERSEVIVAEGYMDVIALDQAGFAQSVAPLGTALTEDQMTELWRHVPEPVLCFDGDEAGLRAAASAAARALPLLKPGRSLRFAMLPEGSDPDSLLRKDGAQAILEVIERATPLARMVWALETGGPAPDTPERRARLRERLEARAGAVRDAKVRDEYRRYFEGRYEAVFGGPPRTGSKPWPPGFKTGLRRPPGPPAPGLPAGEGARTRFPADEILIKTLLAAVVNHPELLDEVGEELGSAEFLAPGLDRLRQAVVGASGLPGLDSDALKSHLRDQGFSGELRAVLRSEIYQHGGFARPEASLDTVRKGWREAFGKYQLPALHAQVREAEAAVARDMTPENQQRYYDLKKRLYELQSKAREWLG